MFERKRSESRTKEDLPVGGTWVPSLSTYKIAIVTRPLKTVATSIFVGVGGSAGAIGPPGVEKSTVVALRAGGTGASLEKVETFGGVCSGRSDGTDDSAGSSEEGQELHDERSGR